MNSETNSGRSLREMEQEVEAEGREWMRQRLQKKLQAEADGLGLVFPPERVSGQASAQRNDASAHGLRAHQTRSVAGKKSR
jgi:hypothetical protein